MVKAIRVYEHGSPEMMKFEEVVIGEPNTGEIKMKNVAIGINFLDVMMRQVAGYAPPLPYTPGMEAVGVVIAIGPEVTSCKVGDMVAYAGFHVCAYAEEMILPADMAVQVPRSIDPIIAAAAIFKGLTAEILVRRCFKVGPGHTILFHAVAGGVGSLACQWANALGATVIGTVSSKEKAEQAKNDGCHHVIIYKQENVVDRVMEITTGRGVDVVYDSIGKDTFEGSLACVRARGHMISFGSASGDPEVNYEQLSNKSIYFTVPQLFLYTEARNELLAGAEEVFSNIEKGVLRVRVNKYPLSQAVQAHSDLENQKTTGSLVLIPDN